MDLQKLYSYTRQAIDEYHMIENNDHIAVGISGGKDSLALLYALSGLRRFYPKAFRITAITVDLGYDGFDLSKIQDLCGKLDVPYEIVNTQIAEMVKDKECSLCSRLRKGALTNKAVELGCNKIAYAHNMDDVVETLLLSLIYEGRLSTFWPVTTFEDKGISVIRPLIYAPVHEIVSFSQKYNLPISKNPCPYDGITKRTEIRELLKTINEMAPGAKKRMMTAAKSTMNMPND